MKMQPRRLVMEITFCVWALASHLNAALPHYKASSQKTKRFVLIGRFVLPKFNTRRTGGRMRRSRMIMEGVNNITYHNSQKIRNTNEAGIAGLLGKYSSQMNEKLDK